MHEIKLLNIYYQMIWNKFDNIGYEMTRVHGHNIEKITKIQ